MARVLVYERSLDAILTDQVSSCSYEFSLDRVKEEPPDPSEKEVVDSSMVNQETQPNQTPHSLLNNKENEYLTNRKPKKTRKRYDEYRRRRKRVNKNKSVVKNSTNEVSKNRRHFNEISENFCETSSPREKNKNLRSVKLATGKSKKAMTLRNNQTLMNIFHECSVCLLEFDFFAELQEHTRLYSHSSYQCPKCDAEYIRISSLKRHSVTCTGRPNRRRKFECDVCNRMFETKTNLQAHIYHTHYDLFCGSKKIKFDSSLTTAANSKSPSRESSISNASSPGRKLRQTTLMEFLRIHNKNDVQEISPKRLVDQLETKQNRNKLNEDSGCSTASESRESNPLLTAQESGSKSIVANAPFSGRTTPFVQIHDDPELIMKLLDTGLSLKEEPPDDDPAYANANARQNSPYSLRPKSLVDATYHPFQHEKIGYRKRVHSGVFSDSNKSCDGTTAKRPRKSPVKAGSENYHSLIKKCSVPLIRCDHLLKPAANTTDSHRTTTSMSCTEQSDQSINLVNNAGDNENLKKMGIQLPNLSCNDDGKEEVSTVISNNDFDTLRKVYRCKVCSQRFSLKKSLSKHLNAYHSIYISSICSANYSSRQELLYHYLTQHTIFKRTTCCVCGETFENRYRLQGHLLLHCIKVLWTQNEIAPVDVKMNCNVYKKQNKCHRCKKRFWLPSCLEQHSSVCSAVKKTVESSDQSQQKSMLRKKSQSSNRRTVDLTKHQKRGNAVMALCAPKVQSRISDPEIIWIPETGEIFQSNVKSESIDLEDTVLTNAGTMAAVEITKSECLVCGRRFNTAASLHRHEQIFSKPFAEQCAICGTEFPTKQMLKAHITATHNQPQRKYGFHCKFCHQGFVKKDRYVTHETHLHDGQIDMMPVQTWLNQEQVWNVNTMCSVCDLMFGTFDQFIMHNVYYYQGHIFTCGFCRQTFNGMYMLHRHRKLVHYPKETQKSYSHVCDICNEGFGRESLYHAHKLHVHTKESTRSLNSGIKSPQQKQPLPEIDTFSTIEPKQIALGIYACTVCQLTFTNENDLTRHELEYNLRGEYKCVECSKSYPTQDILDQHYSLSHMGCDVPNDYKCRICGEVLITSISMKCHFKHFHSWGDDHTYTVAVEPIQKSVSNTLNQDLCNDGGLRVSGRTMLAGTSVSCRTCKTVFDSGIKLKNHLLRYSNIGEHVCAVCHRRFVEKHRLDLHKMKHSRLNVLLSEQHCPICQEGFQTLTQVQIHVLHYHGYETFQDILDKRGCFKIDRSSNCTGNFRLQSKANVAASILILDADTACYLFLEGDKELDILPVASNIGYTVIKDPNGCMDKFSSTEAATDERITSRILCKVCNTKFKNRKSLGKHIARFSNVGEYKCDICQLRFPWQTTYAEHYRKHTRTRWNTRQYWKYSCYYCSEQFRALRTARFHLLHIHKKHVQQLKIKARIEPGNKQVTQGVIPTQNVFLDDEIPNIVNSSDKLYVETRVESDNLTAKNGNDVAIVNEIDNVSMANGKVLEGGVSGMNSGTSSRSQAVLDTTSKPISNLRRYLCSICLVRCLDEETYYFHYKSVHGKDANPLIADTIPKPMVIINCVICDAWFINKITLKKHVTKWHPELVVAIEVAQTVGERTPTPVSQ